MLVFSGFLVYLFFKKIREIRRRYAKARKADKIFGDVGGNDNVKRSSKREPDSY